MAREHTHELLPMLEAFPPQVRETALWLRDYLWALFPECNELIYDNYNALAIGWGLSDKLGDVFCSMAVYSHVNLGFNRGSELPDPAGILQGKGNIYRYITITDLGLLGQQEVRQLLNQAYVNALSRAKPAKNPASGRTIVKSISQKKRRPAI